VELLAFQAFTSFVAVGTAAESNETETSRLIRFTVFGNVNICDSAIFGKQTPDSLFVNFLS